MHVLITGGNSGLGFETARALAKEGHHLILTSRSPAAAADACQRLRAEFPQAQVRGEVLDLCDFKSIEAFASRVLSRLEALDVLLLNAGIMAPPYQRTVDGFESQFQANYLGHFDLFQRLLPLILRSEVRKVISLSSLSSEKGTCDSLAAFEAVARADEASYQPMRSYRESKLAQVLFTVEAARRLGEQGVKVAAIHPGVVNTPLFYRTHRAPVQWLIKGLAWVGILVGGLRTPAKGAQTSVFLATTAWGQNGLYWADCQPRDMNPIAQDPALGKALWDWSMQQLPAASSV